MAKLTISTSRSDVEPKEIPIRDWFPKDTYTEVKLVAKFVLDSNADTTPRSAARDLLNGKYTTKKQVTDDLKIVSDYAVLVVRSHMRLAKANMHD